MADPTGDSTQRHAEKVGIRECRFDGDAKKLRVEVFCS